MSTAVQDLEQEVMPVPARAKALVIRTAEDYISAGELLKIIKGLRASVNETFDPIISKAHEAHKEAIAQKKKYDGPLSEAESILKPRIAAYLEEQERIRREEELRQQRAAQEEAERQQLADAALLDDIGETEMANALLDESPIVAPVIVPRVTPKVAGISTQKRYSAKVTDLKVLLTAVLAGRVPIQAIKADDVFLNRQAVALKEAFNYPGVQLVTDSNVAVRR